MSARLPSQGQPRHRHPLKEQEGGGEDAFTGRAQDKPGKCNMQLFVVTVVIQSRSHSLLTSPPALESMLWLVVSMYNIIIMLWWVSSSPDDAVDF